MTGIDRRFGEKLLDCFDDPNAYGVHLLFNEWWQTAPEAVIAKYREDFDRLPEQARFSQDRWFGPQLSVDGLKAHAPGSLGRAYHDFIVDNGLEANLATNYTGLHQMMVASGKLDRMPDEMRFAIIRGFQIHDLNHVLAGYAATPIDEIGLQAFCLAQIRFPYFGMWMSVVTARMTLLDPDAIAPAMTAISEGWLYGRRARNLQFARWEEMFDRPLVEIRSEYRLGRDPALALAA